ncbi:type IV pilus inner membrane component PilO [Diaphorobacter aerolatus]|uniref:Type 4a pilus biogenesis protein PilO n=1 Tax=Diaphorobacter aerolatus TaxID=1288495 RepID=A0A7H0GNI2_9BURK|nr:type 4a pilus biogenesis protein PilO [Diaphorobacter aerolatus]QNP49848.1 type 4a pilus biogenesis protein PilO [Diaphorobacter aerolatus]
MASKRAPKMDVAQAQENLRRQFTNLDPKDPSLWPIVPKILLCAFITALVVGGAWYFWLTDYEDQLKAEEAKEVTLREDYTKKLTKAVSLEALKKQREQVQQYVTQLEKQLPSKAEMSALLSDINQAGLGRSLQFETFRPGQVVAKDYYAELPITVRVTGKYPDIGSFASDIANLSRIVTLNNLSIAPINAKDGSSALAMDATAKTFRYLDQEEIAEQKKAADAARKKK